MPEDIEEKGEEWGRTWPTSYRIRKPLYSGRFGAVQEHTHISVEGMPDPGTDLEYMII